MLPMLRGLLCVRVRRRLATSLAPLGALIVASLLPLPALGSCAGVCLPSEVVVEETATACRCRDRVQYARCIGKAGAQYRTDRGNCAFAVQGIFADAGQALNEPARVCVRRSLENGLSICETIERCTFPYLPPIAAADYATLLMTRAVNKFNECFERVLQNQRLREANCKKEEDD